MIRVQTEPFDVAAEIALVRAGRTDIGAIVTFTGLVRDLFPQDRLVAMTLEHYPGMTEAELERLAEEAKARWPLAAVTIIHRAGRLLPGDDIVLVVTASAHRTAAFEAAHFLMDFLKTQAPFWKIEETERDKRWVEAKATDGAATSLWSRKAT